MAWILIVLLIIADQLTKYLTKIYISKTRPIVVIDKFFYLSHRVNKGAAWSFLAEKSWGIYVLSSISAIVSLILLYIIYKTNIKSLKIILSIIAAGSIGNLIDRVFFGGVIDFLEFHFGSYIFPTFNVADSLIVCGTIALVILLAIDKRILGE